MISLTRLSNTNAGGEINNGKDIDSDSGEEEEDSLNNPDESDTNDDISDIIKY
jgi:hypothetical protein